VRGRFDLQDPDSPRMEVALDLLSEGAGFYYRGVWFHREDARLRCDAAVAYGGGIGLSEAKALRAVDQARETLAELKSRSQEFAAAVASLSPQFAVIDDYEIGWVPIVELVDGKLEWRLKARGGSAD
jgi:hypothetical protein